MTPKSETDKIWEIIEGAKPLQEIYGYWPMLHDARVRAFDVDFSSREIRITVDYSDVPYGLTGKTPVSTRMTLCWHNVQSAKLRHYGSDLYGMKFRQTGLFIETEFSEYCWGFDGTIVCSAVTVENIQPSPDTSHLTGDEPEYSNIAFSFG